jgi:signal peptidase II
VTRGAAVARAAGLAVVVLAADQLTKALARGAVERGEQDAVLPGVKLVNSRNTGVAFGFLDGGGPLVGILVAVALALLLGFLWRFGQRRGAWVAVGLLVGGALGNVIDRVREGAVTDFVKLPAWPAFNLADACITAGVLVLVLVLERADGARSTA